MYILFWALSLVGAGVEAGAEAGGGRLMRWLPDLSLGRAANWQGGSAPCAADRAVLPRRPAAALSLPPLLGLAALTLPAQGVLRLPRDGRLVLGETPSATCPGRVARFEEKVELSWADPANWAEVAAPPGDADEGGEAVPHAERLPCQVDTAEFLPGSAAGVRLPGAPQRVRALLYDGRALSQDSWAELQRSTRDSFIRGDEGGGVEVRPAPESCGEGCPCQVSEPPEMCTVVTCPPPSCLSPVRPVGHCCPVCGAVVTVRGGGASSAAVRRLLRKEKGLRGEGRVQWWVGAVSRKGGPAVQIVLVSRPGYPEADQTLAIAVQERIQQEWKLGASGLVQWSASGPSWADAAGPGGLWLALATLAVVALGLGGLMVCYHPPAAARAARFAPDTSLSGFARFNNRSREGSLALGISQFSLDKAFDNPMYATMEKQKEEEYEVEQRDITEMKKKLGEHSETMFEH